MILDLHGYSIHAGWKEFCCAMDEAKLKKVRSLRVITGQGTMKQEFPRWCDRYANIRTVTLNSDGGSFTLKFFKNSR